MTTRPLLQRRWTLRQSQRAEETLSLSAAQRKRSSVNRRLRTFMPATAATRCSHSAPYWRLTRGSWPALSFSGHSNSRKTNTTVLEDGHSRLQDYRAFRLSSPSLQGVLFQRSWPNSSTNSTTYFRARVFRVVVRFAASVHYNFAVPPQVGPFQIFRLLLDPQRWAPVLLNTPECIWCHQIPLRSGCAPPASHQSAWLRGTARTRGHDGFLKMRGVQAHVPCTEDSNSESVIHKIRCEKDSWYGDTGEQRLLPRVCAANIEVVFVACISPSPPPCSRKHWSGGNC